MLQCGFNLLIHGVGSKIDFLNLFSQTCLLPKQGKAVVVFNGFTASCNMRTVTSLVKQHLMRAMETVDGERPQEIFGGNIGLTEKVNVLVKEFQNLKARITARQHQQDPL